MIKLIMTWDIKPGHEQDYFTYVLHEYLPQVNKFSFDVTDARHCLATVPRSCWALLWLRGSKREPCWVQRVGASE